MSTVIVDYRVDFFYLTIMLAPEQSRAARAWLGWSQDDLAKRAHVALSTVRDFEKGRRVPIKNNLDAIRLSLEMVGVTLVFRGDVALGIQVVLTGEPTLS